MLFGVVINLPLDWPIFFDSYQVRGYNSPLMSGQQRLPLELDPFRMADLGRRFSGKVEISSLKRLLPVLESTTGCVDVELQFDIDEVGIRYLHGKLATDLVLKCQRCLTAMEFPLRNEFWLAFIQNDIEAEHLPEQYEPQLVESTPMRVLDMLEDEILLSIPYIPVHSDASCSNQQFSNEDELAEQRDEVVANPFAILGKLKKDH